MMNEILTIVSSILGLVSVAFGIVINVINKSKEFYKTYIEIENKIKELCILAESNYKDGAQKKKYVLNAIKVFITENNIKFDEGKLSDIIEKVIDITKKINVSAGVK